MKSTSYTNQNETRVNSVSSFIDQTSSSNQCPSNSSSFVISPSTTPDESNCCKNLTENTKPDNQQPYKQPEVNQSSRIGSQVNDSQINHQLNQNNDDATLRRSKTKDDLETVNKLNKLTVNQSDSNASLKDNQLAVLLKSTPSNTSLKEDSLKESPSGELSAKQSPEHVYSKPLPKPPKSIENQENRPVVPVKKYLINQNDMRIAPGNGPDNVLILNKNNLVSTKINLSNNQTNQVQQMNKINNQTVQSNGQCNGRPTQQANGQSKLNENVLRNKKKSDFDVIAKLKTIVNLTENPFSRYTSISANKIIGEGASGKVYIATDLKTLQKVAIKQIDINAQQKNDLIINEIIVMKQNHHPNVVNYLDSVSVMMSVVQSGH